MTRRRRSRHATASQPEISTGRYTPPQRALRFRPTWHKGVGGMAIVVGATLFVVCEANVGHIHQYGGHIWYLVGFAIAATSVWWFGAFDPP